MYDMKSKTSKSSYLIPWLNIFTQNIHTWLAWMWFWPGFLMVMSIGLFFGTFWLQCMWVSWGESIDSVTGVFIGFWKLNHKKYFLMLKIKSSLKEDWYKLFINETSWYLRWTDVFVDLSTVTSTSLSDPLFTLIWSAQFTASVISTKT